MTRIVRVGVLLSVFGSWSCATPHAAAPVAREGVSESAAPARDPEATPSGTESATTPSSSSVSASTAGVGVVRDHDALTVEAPPTEREGCLRLRQTTEWRCSGMAPRPGEPDVHAALACDRCLTDADCAAEPGTRCTNVGGQRCAGPERRECRLPRSACDPRQSRECGEPPISYPPSRPDDDR